MNQIPGSQNASAVSSNFYIGYFPPSPFGPTWVPYIPPALPSLPQPIIQICNAPPEPYFPYKIRQVSNGFILSKNGIEYVFSDIKELSKFLEKDVKACKG